MPLFQSKKRNNSVPSSLSDSPLSDNEDDQIISNPNLQTVYQSNNVPHLVFHCQLSHGSRTGTVSGFHNMKQLYEKIADSLAISYTDVSYDDKFTNLSSHLILFAAKTSTHARPLSCGHCAHHIVSASVARRAGSGAGDA